MEKSTWDWIAGILVVVGALNWGLYGLGMLMGSGAWNLVETVFGSGTLAAIVYLLVGISGIYMLIKMFK
jgi:uncharacterized membrane protein YuzA (DUF378 family)